MPLLALALLITLYGFVSSESYEEQKAQESFYCEMVKAGHWPAYKKTINCDK